MWLPVNRGGSTVGLWGAVCCSGWERGTRGKSSEFGVRLDSDVGDLEQVTPLLLVSFSVR